MWLNLSPMRSSRSNRNHGPTPHADSEHGDLCPTGPAHSPSVGRHASAAAGEGADGISRWELPPPECASGEAPPAFLAHPQRDKGSYELQLLLWRILSFNAASQWLRFDLNDAQQWIQRGWLLTDADVAYAAMSSRAKKHYNVRRALKRVLVALAAQHELELPEFARTQPRAAPRPPRQYQWAPSSRRSAAAAAAAAADDDDAANADAAAAGPLAGAAADAPEGVAEVVAADDAVNEAADHAEDAAGSAAASDAESPAPTATRRRAPPAAPSGGGSLTPYEEERARNIASNYEELRRLGLAPTCDDFRRR